MTRNKVTPEVATKLTFPLMPKMHQWPRITTAEAKAIALYHPTILREGELYTIKFKRIMAGVYEIFI